MLVVVDIDRLPDDALVRLQGDIVTRANLLPRRKTDRVVLYDLFRHSLGVLDDAGPRGSVALKLGVEGILSQTDRSRVQTRSDRSRSSNVSGEELSAGSRGVEGHGSSLSRGCRLAMKS